MWTSRFARIIVTTVVVVVLIFVVALVAFQVCMFPRVDAPVALIFDGWLKTRFSFEFHLAFERDVYFQTIVEDYYFTSHEVVFEPEVVGRKRGIHVPNSVIFEHVARP